MGQILSGDAGLEVLPSPVVDIKALLPEWEGRNFARCLLKFCVIKQLICVHLAVENYFSLPKIEKKLQIKKKVALEKE